jgi:hypothetical protein
MSILVNYYRLPPSERQNVTRDQATWDDFKSHLLQAQSQAFRDAIAKVKVDGLSPEARVAKINAAIEQNHDPRQFDLEKDWHMIAYLLTGDPKIKDEHLPDAPLHNVIFGGLKTTVTTGYGPVRYFDAKLVAEITAALVGADRKIIAGRYDPAAMKKLEIYAPREEDGKKLILAIIEELTAYFQKAAAAHEDVVKYVS